MTVLDKIIQRKKAEVAEAKTAVPEDLLRELPAFGRRCLSLREALNDSSQLGIIAEFKRASPSKGLINGHSSVADVVRGYQQAGAAAVSVLTDRDFFQGQLSDLVEAREHLSIPLLRKDFIVDRYQITEAKAYGADIILLIAAALEPEEVHSLSEYAKSLGLNVLLEVHNRSELEANRWRSVDAVGVNNRNLHDFSVSVAHSLDLADMIPDHYLKISESGISDPAMIALLKRVGYRGFLIGEMFMKTDDPVASIQKFSAGIGRQLL